MDKFLEMTSCLMLIVLVTTQLLLASPYRENMVDESLSGRNIKTYETLIYKGALTLNAVGKYAANSAVILINGDPQKTVDSFPVIQNVVDGDVIEIQVKSGSPSFYVYITDKKGQIAVDTNESSFLIKPGVNRIVKIFRNN